MWSKGLFWPENTNKDDGVIRPFKYIFNSTYWACFFPIVDSYKYGYSFK